ncbi:MAG TPA: ATP-binding protein [Pirellulaceae bacterium]|nr:ATP-binding protein [Pirellulaceae bacterium]
MGEPIPPKSRGSTISIWSCVIAAVAVVGLLGGGIAAFDVQRAVDDLRGEELRRLQFNAERTGAQIEGQLLESKSRDVASIKEAPWLRRYWSQNLMKQSGRLYAAVVDRAGRIVAHTNPDLQGRQPASADFDATESSPATRLFTGSDEVLTLGEGAINVQVSIYGGGDFLGSYLTGLDAGWLDERLAAERWSRARFWAILVAGMCALLLLSSVAVVRVTRHTARLEYELDAAHARRISEMHELVLGIAHEIRNPLNAIRLNLHTIGQVFRDEAALDDAEIRSMLGEMTREITRLENLMREMLGFVQTSADPPAPVDVSDEVQRAVSFFGPNLERRGVQVRLDVGEACRVAMDGRRLRQVLLNLLNNALEALPAGGNIEISVQRRRGQIEVSVTDDGPGIRTEDRERVFVPFYSTKASGTGLGLALARKFVEEAGGTIACEERPDRPGCRFRIVLPASTGAEVELAT